MFSFIQIYLGFVIERGQKFNKVCSLKGAKYMLVDERIYCANKNANMNQTRAIEYCKKRNATLPLPISLLEFEVFSNLSGLDNAWISISDPSSSGKTENWKDVQNKKPAYVKLRVKIFNEILLDLYIYLKPTESGTKHTQMGLVQQLFLTLAAYITRIKLKAIKLSVFKVLHVSVYISFKSAVQGLKMAHIEFHILINVFQIQMLS